MISLNSTVNLWYGTESSLLVLTSALEALDSVQAGGEDSLKTAIRLRGGGSSSDPFELPSMVETKDGVSVISIQGSLINGNAGFMRLFGVTGYGDIADALLQAAASKDTKSIVLAIDSGGGHVNGLEDVGNLIQQVGMIKPVLAHTDGSMGSAAYWLGASANKVLGTKSSQVGSVGTLIVHTEYSKMLADEGVKKTLVKHGEFKGLGNPYEPLTEAGKAQFQTLADEAGRLFVEYAAGRRGVSPAEFQKTMGEGRVFMGLQAHKVGLLDGVMSGTDAISFAKSLDTQKASKQNSRNPKDSTMKAALSKKTLLAIAAGAAVEALSLNSVEANAQGVQLDATALVELTAEATELIAARDAAAATSATAQATAISTAVTAAKAELQVTVDKLTADLKATSGKLVIAEAAATTLNEKLTASADLASKASEIVKASLSVMSVAMGGAADVGAALVGTELLAQHTVMKENFIKKFPAGGVAAVNAGPPNKAVVGSQPPPEFTALLPHKQVQKA